MTRRLLAASLFALPFLAASAASGAPSRDALVLPGRGIGRITLGMTPEQVRRALGRHTLVNERKQLGFGIEYLELDWDWARWTVGFQGRPGSLRAVKVATMLRRERTRHGLGYGSTIRDVLRVFPRAGCSSWAGLGTNSSKERWVYIQSPTGARTIFVIHFELTRGGRPPPGRVIEVKVQLPARGLAEQRDSCGQNWRSD